MPLQNRWEYLPHLIVIPEATSMLAHHKQTLREIGRRREDKGFVAALHSKELKKFYKIEDTAFPAPPDPRYKKFGFIGNENINKCHEKVSIGNSIAEVNLLSLLQK